MFTTKECAWAQTSLRLLSRTIIGAQGFEFDIDIDKEHLFAAGSKPIDIQSGNEKPTGNIKILKFELDQLNDAAQLAGFDNIAKVPHELILITCAFKKLPTDPIRIVEAAGVAFTKVNTGMAQNAKMTEVTLPFLAMDISFRKGS
jgi:hypothetical protein